MATTTPPRISPEFFTEMQSKALEAFTVFADMNHRVLQQLVDLSASAAKESLRASSDLQTAAVEAIRTNKIANVSPDGFPQNPFAWCQKGLLTVVEGTQQAYRLLETNAQAVTRTAERLQASADHAGREIQESLTSSVNRVKEIYSRN